MPAGAHAAGGARASACPGLLRIVAAKDGGLCRIKLPGGALSAAQAHAIADACTRYAAGAIEVTNRANLQVRGVRAGQEQALIDALVKAGLGPMRPLRDGTDSCDAGTAAASASAADDIRNVMISPIAGRDPSALFDTTPLCADLLTLLQNEPRFGALSPKFALLLDGGERLARIDHPHDVWLAAIPADDGVRFVFGLAGCPPEAVGSDAQDPTEQSAVSALATASPSALPTTPAASPTASHIPHIPHIPRHTNRNERSIALAAVSPGQVPTLIRALLHTFLDLAASDATRMRDLLATHSVDAILHHAQRHADFPLTRDIALTHWRRSVPADAMLRLGAHPQRPPGTWHTGGQPPLGRLSADALRGLAELAQRHNHGTLRMTPWQSVLLPDISTDAVPAVLDGLNALGLATRIADPIARLIACAGSSGCAKSLADTKADALQLASHVPAHVELHLSGCPRSCAAAHCAPYTLLASAPGVYDLYRRDGQQGFGQCIAQRLMPAEAAGALASIDHDRPHPTPPRAPQPTDTTHA
nr:Sulfite reductase [ferredoxin] [Paraburkholderia busanensis]